MYQTDDEVVVKAALPGFKTDDVQINITGDVLTIRGEMKHEEEKKDKAFILHERLAHTFERRFQLPEDADTAKLKANFDHGVLEIHAPKAPEAKPRKVKIEPVA